MKFISCILSHQHISIAECVPTVSVCQMCVIFVIYIGSSTVSYTYSYWYIVQFHSVFYQYYENISNFVEMVDYSTDYLQGDDAYICNERRSLS